jgi:hypothetical protein
MTGVDPSRIVVGTPATQPIRPTGLERYFRGRKGFDEQPPERPSGDAGDSRGSGPDSGAPGASAEGGAAHLIDDYG